MVTELKLTNYWAQRSLTIQQVFHELSCFRSSKEKGWKKTRRKKMTRGKHKKPPAEFKPSCPLHALLQRWNLCTNWPRPPLSSWTDAVWHPSMLCWQGGNKTTLFPFSTMSELHSSTITAADTDLFTTTLTHVCSITSSRNTCASRSLCKSTQRIFVFCHFSLQTARNDVSQRENN